MIGPILFLGDEPLRAHVLGVDVDAGLGVVDEIPTGVVGIIVDDEVVARAVPAPAGSEVPVPRSDFKREGAGEPEAVRAEVEAVDMIAIGRTEMFEAAVWIGMRDDVTLVIRTIMAVPVVFVNVRDAVDASTGAPIDFGLGMDIAVRGRFGNMAVVGVHVVVALAAGMFARTLCLRGCADRHSSKECQC